MGEAIELYFDSVMQWSYNDGFFYITGRDIICLIAGLFLGIVIMGVGVIIDDCIERRIKHV